MENAKKWKNSIDNIAGGGKLNSGKNKIHNIILRRNEIMKKKLIIAAAIAFAVFAVPYGSSALSTVSVASENNTVAPTPAPVVDVDKVKVSIDNISITDVSSADEAVAILKNNIGIQTLRAALWQSYDLREELYGRLEQEYADAKGIQISKPNFTDDFNKEYSDEWWVSSEGVALNDCAELQVDAPTIKPSVSGVTSICYLDFSLINAEGRKVGAAVNVPVGIGVSVPAGMDPAKVVVYHFAADGSIDEIIDPEWYVDETSGRDSVYFLVDHFSTFAIAEVETTGAEGSDNAFERYRDSIANEIANAKDGATVKITRDKNINALPNDIMKALYKKQTVALELEYTFEGNEYKVTIPAGKAEDNAIEWYGPLYLQMRYGK